MSTVGYGDKVPRTCLGKILAMVWIFTSIILISLFTANASAIFSTTKVESHIQTKKDLLNVRVGASLKSSGQEFLIREKIDHQAYDSVEEAIEAMLTGKIDCVVSNVPVLLYLNNSKYPQRLAIAPKLLLKNNMGIALANDSPLREEIDQVLLRKISEPKWQNAVYSYLGEEFY